MKTYCFKLYRSERNEKLNKQINSAALIYNHCIALHKRYFKLFGKHIHKYTLRKHLTKLKKLPKFKFIKDFDAQAVEDIVFRIDRAYELFFRNLKRKICCSPPNFKKVKNYTSFTLRQHGWKIDEDTHTIFIRSQKYRYFKDRRISGNIKTVTIKRDSLGDIYILFSVDEKGWADDLWKRQCKTSLIEAVPLTPQFAEKTRRSSAGFDFGLKTFLTAFNGKDIISPLFFAQNSTLIKNACKKLSHKVKGSNNRLKAKLNLSRLYKKSFNQRHDFHFKLARQLCLEYEKSVLKI